MERQKQDCARARSCCKFPEGWLSFGSHKSWYCIQCNVRAATQCDKIVSFISCSCHLNLKEQNQKLGEKLLSSERLGRDTMGYINRGEKKISNYLGSNMNCSVLCHPLKKTT